MVRNRVAKSELTFSMPIFAKIAVIAANTADNRAQNVQEEKKPEPMFCPLSITLFRMRDKPPQKSNLKALDRFELRIPQHQPLAAFAEVHLHAGLSASAFEVEDHAVAEDRVPYRLAQA